MQSSDLKGTGGEWLGDHKDRRVKDGYLVELLMNGDLSSHTLTVSNTQNQLQLSQTEVMINFTGEMWQNMKFLTGFSLEMTRGVCAH